MATTGKKPKAIGVVFKDETGNEHKVLLSSNSESEVILSSGAIGTPQMLLLSGIGPRPDLEKWNISMVLDNEFVGKDMADNPMNAIFVPSNRPVQQSLIQAVGITKLGVYIESSSGFGQSDESIHCHHGLMSAEVNLTSLFSLHNKYTNVHFVLEKLDPLSFSLHFLGHSYKSSHLSLFELN